VADPATLLPLAGVRGVAGLVVQKDTNTPVTLTDSNGNPVPNPVQVTELGVMPGFWVEEGFTHVQWVSGTWRLDMRSADGLELSAVQAAASAALAAEAAEAARNEAQTLVGVIPDGGTVGQVLTVAQETPERVLEFRTPSSSGGGTGGAVESVAGRTGVVTLVKADVGLSNVDNTSDANKPVSGPQAAALAPKAHTHQIGDVTELTATLASKRGMNDAVDASLLTGTVAQARLGTSGTRDSTTFLRGDGAWAIPPGGGGGGADTVDTLGGTGTAGRAAMKAETKAAGRSAFDAQDVAWRPAIADVAGTGAAGRSVMAAATGALARDAIGAAATVHTHTASQITDLADAVEPLIEPAVAQLASELGDQAVARTVYGSHDGAILRPWNVSPAIGAEWWKTSNFHGSGQTETVEPSLTANGQNIESITYVKLDTANNGGLNPWRLEFDFEAPASGWASIHLSLRTAGQAIIGAEQYVVTHESPRRTGHVVVDFQVPEFNGNFVYLKVHLELKNNVTAGQILAMRNASLRATPRVVPPLLVAYGFAPGAPTVWMRHTNARGVRKTTKTLLNGGGIASTLGFNTWTPWRWSLPEPSFLDATGAWDAKVGSDEVKVGLASTDLDIGNNDQILSVQKNDLSFELRGNVHGGETSQAGNPVYKIDEGKGAGLVVWDATEAYLRPCRRYQVQWDTALTRTGDTEPFALVDHLTTVFDDGMMRTDRSTTFPKAAVIGDTFEWMSSHKVSPLWLGRIGKGQTVIAEADTRGLLAPPAQPTATGSTTGGTLPAQTWNYYTTYVTPFGESTASPVRSVTTTGTTSSVTVGWAPLPTGAAGVRVYRAQGSGVPYLVATVTGGLSYVDTGIMTQPATLPTVNTARTSTPTRREVGATDATWAVWYDPEYDLCYANIFDRDALLSRAGVAQSMTRLQMVPGSITKEYINAVWTGETGTIAVGPSTPAWVATHWGYVYSPNDPVNYHREVADKAANLGALKAMYPND
jgi:hypothetical protein